MCDYNIFKDHLKDKSTKHHLTGIIFCVENDYVHKSCYVENRK